MHAVRTIAGALFGLAILLLPTRAPSADAQLSVEVAMASQSGSGESGQTVLYAEGDRTRVVVHLDNPVAGPQPAHIHLGSCPMPNATPLYPLNAVTNGRSETVLDVNMGALVAQPMAINVHLSPQDIPVYVACGDIALDDDTTAETTIDSVRENAREDINQEQKRERDKDKRFKP